MIVLRHRNAKQYPEAESVPGVLIFRVDAPIYFANVEFVKDKLRKYELYHIGESFGCASISSVMRASKM